MSLIYIIKIEAYRTTLFIKRGPSGAGKTSLLNILSGRSRSRGAITIGSNVEMNKVKINQHKMSVRKKIAFVPQEESLQITQTPRDCQALTSTYDHRRRFENIDKYYN